VSTRAAQPPFFIADGDRFVATESTRGPWHRDYQHGGPPAALLTRALEHLAGDRFLLTRVTFDFVRPVPIARLAVRAETARAGAKVLRLRAVLTTADDTPLVQASAVALRTASLLPSTLGDDGGHPPASAGLSAPFEFEFLPDAIGYHTAMETRIASGTWGKGPVFAWMRPRVALFDAEPISPLQRLMTAVDSSSGVAVVLDPAHHTFVNADLTVAVHRPPEGEWIGLDTATVVEAHGIGLTRARLWDARGAFGVSLQSCLAEARPK
jgi:hypothetical protein